MVKKLFKIFKLVFSANIIFRIPKKIDLIIFDETSLRDLKKYLFRKKKFLVLINNYLQIKEIYLHPKIIFKIMLNFKHILKKNILIQDLYFLSVIQCIKPSIVFTFIDNSFQFSKLNKINDDKKIKFIALQNGSRIEWKEQDYLFKKKKITKNLNLNYFINYFLSFGNLEITESAKYNLKIKNIIPVGSIRLANFLNDLKLKNTKILKNKYDICLVSDHSAWSNIHSGICMNSITNADLGIIKLTKYAIKFCKKFKLSLVMCFKRKIGNPGYTEEQKWFKDNLSEEELKFILKNSNQLDGVSSYKYSFESNVVLGTMSTLLRENLACGNKILSCNLTKSSIYNFPLKGICSLNNCEYKEFEKRLYYIFKTNKKNYFLKINKNKNFLIKNNKPELCFKTIMNSIDQISKI